MIMTTNGMLLNPHRACLHVAACSLFLMCCDSLLPLERSWISTKRLAPNWSERTYNAQRASQHTAQRTAHRPHLEHTRLPVLARGAVSSVVLERRTMEHRAFEKATRVVSH
jgi:hypothetical protein